MKYIQIIICFFLFLSACTTPCTSQKDEIKGDIIKLLDIPCPFFGKPKKGNNGFIIQDYKDCKNKFSDKVCSSLQGTNFRKYSILGSFTLGSGCRTFYRRQLKINHYNKKYIYTVSVFECGGCLPARFSLNMVLVPALPDQTYEVEFKNIYYNTFF